MTPTAESVTADAVLQAARQAVAQHRNSNHLSYEDVSLRNRELMPLLDALLEATFSTAAAITDNAWDEGQAVPHDYVNHAVAVSNRVASTVANAAAVPARLSLL